MSYKSYLKQKQNRNGRLRKYHAAHPTYSYAKLGRIFKLTRERVRQILSKES
jgi:DNA-directed RNA polymerase sigma subunit (sigma70/sigma32)